MGNENNPQHVNDNNKDKGNTGHQKQPKRPPDKKMSHQEYAEFFIQHHKRYNASNMNDLSLLDPRRIVFISLRDLHESWTRCPSMSLYNAILLLPLKKAWILSPHKYEHEYSELLEDTEFVTFLRWKEHQHLAIFLLDNSDPIDTTERKESLHSQTHMDDPTFYTSISPVWWRLSNLLQTLHDPMRSEKYDPLIFSERYWRTQSSLDKDSVDHIMKELYTVTMRFKSMEHILCESNHTLNVIVNYTPQQVVKRKQLSKSHSDEADDSILDEDWWIADDYHEDVYDEEAIRLFEDFVNSIDVS
eukprot:115592_1